MAVGGRRGVRIYDTASQREAAYLSNPDAVRHDIAFDPRSGDIFAIVGDAALVRWAVTNRTDANAARAYDERPRELRTSRGEFAIQAMNAPPCPSPVTTGGCDVTTLMPVAPHGSEPSTATRNARIVVPT